MLQLIHLKNSLIKSEIFETIKYSNYFKLNKNGKQNTLYYNESIYILNYFKDKDIYVSYGKLLDINNNEIIHNIVLEIYFRDFKKKINYKNVEKILKKIDQQWRGHPLSNG